MKLVKFFKDISCPHGSFKAGEQGEIDGAIAHGLVEAGHAAYVGDEGNIAEAPMEAESAAIEPEGETAEAPRRLFKKKK